MLPFLTPIQYWKNWKTSFRIYLVLVVTVATDTCHALVTAATTVYAAVTAVTAVALCSTAIVVVSASDTIRKRQADLTLFLFSPLLLLNTAYPAAVAVALSPVVIVVVAAAAAVTAAAAPVLFLLFLLCVFL